MQRDIKVLVLLCAAAGLLSVQLLLTVSSVSSSLGEAIIPLPSLVVSLCAISVTQLSSFTLALRSSHAPSPCVRIQMLEYSLINLEMDIKTQLRQRHPVYQTRLRD